MKKGWLIQLHIEESTYCFVSKIFLRSLDSQDLKNISTTQTWMMSITPTSLQVIIQEYGIYNFPVLMAGRYCTYVTPFFIDDSGAEFYAD